MPLKRIGDILIKEKLLTQKQLVKALENKQPEEKIGETLIRLKMLNEMQILKALETSTGVKRVSLTNYVFEPSALKMISEDFCRRNIIIPLKLEGKKLQFATSDPLNFSAIEEIRISAGYQPIPFSSPRDDIYTQIEKNYGFKRTLEALGIDEIDQDEIIDADEETPMVRLVNQILSSAVFQRASDIHVDPLDRKTIIRYRVDGVLDIVRKLPSKIHKQMVNRIKIMAEMDITETRVPQDGRIQTTIQDRKLDLRISTLPTVRGEKVVMRILDLSGSMNKIEYLGLSEEEEVLARDLIAKPNGILLVSGPTGSGKTTTLYAFLNELNTPAVNIVTVEDPVEIKMQGVNQVQVHSDIDLTFANALRSILRQDPNIIMIGEIRDKETAEISIRAALTGHLVLSTIHTNSASKTVTRLLDMNIEPFLIASSLSGVISQRLVRRLCPECNVEDTLTDHEKEVFEANNINPDFKVKRAKGCPSCNFKGYAGRMGLFEILPISKEIENIITKNGSVAEIEKVALKNGLNSLMKSGLLAVKKGETTLEEILKVAEE